MKESRLILILGLVQFINILDFMMVMPLGPDLAKGIGLPAHLIGIIGGSYTLAAAAAGLIGLLFLDRFQRRKATLFCLAGLAISTALCALAWDLNSVLFARVLAGLCGGPLSSLVLAIIADEIPAERRGAAMGKIMGSFAAASVIGVPFGLELSSRFGWRAPFICFGVIGAVLWIYTYINLHLTQREIITKKHSEVLTVAKEIITNQITLTMLLVMAFAMMAGFMIIPNISAHLQQNVGFPREYLGVLYFAGGAVSFFSMRIAGKLVDKYSSNIVSIFFTLTLIIALLLGFVFWEYNLLPVVVVFIIFMVSMSGRNVAVQTLASKVPKQSHRAAFMSLNSSVTHMATSTGAIFSAKLLTEHGSKLIGIENVAMIAIAFCLPVPILLRRIENLIKRQQV